MRFDLQQFIKTDAPEEWCDDFAHMIESLIITAHLAAGNDSSAPFNDSTRQHAVANTLEVASAMIAIVIDGVEILQRETGTGIWRKGV